MSIVTVIPADKFVVVNGEALSFDFEAPANIHAIQWQNDNGHVEFKDPAKFPNKEITQADYNTYVKPYVDAFNKEKARLKADAERREKEYQEWYNSEEQRFVRLRAERDKRLVETDYLLNVDYPISEANLAKVKEYRKLLRDLPGKPGAPWTDETIPWPVKPQI